MISDKDLWNYTPRKPISNKMVFSKEVERANSKARMSLSRDRRDKLEQLTQQWLEEEKTRNS
jgi:hypothetical protein